MATFSVTPLSSQIRVGTEFKSAYQWAAKLAPAAKPENRATGTPAVKDRLIEYKNAMLWLEGEDFASVEDFLAKVERIIEFQTAEHHQPVATNPAPTQPVESTDESDAGGAVWQSAKTTKVRKPKAQFVPWTTDQLAKAIVDRCVDELARVCTFAGPSLDISAVYSRFSSKDFDPRRLLGAVRAEAQKLPQPGRFRYWADGGPGKGKNFNFKLQKTDDSKPNGWSAMGQIHVLWQ
jgi:hypothetical protein